jgi:hypothetical protein
MTKEIQMRISRFCSMVVVGAAAAMAMPSYGQQSDSTPAPTAAPASAANPQLVDPHSVDPRVVARAPTAVASKKANDFGFHAEIYSGKTFFCKDDATLGTRLKSKKCIDGDQFEDYAIQLQIARDTMRKDVCQGGKASLTPTPCGGLP